jgi:hypothetical protein
MTEHSQQGALAAEKYDDHEKLCDLCGAVEAYLKHLGKSVDVGPSTPNPRTETFLLQQMRSALMRAQT